jgi:hypothetical protein
MKPRIQLYPPRLTFSQWLRRLPDKLISHYHTSRMVGDSPLEAISDALYTEHTHLPWVRRRIDEARYWSPWSLWTQLKLYIALKRWRHK